MDPALLLHFYQCLILRALDAEDTDRLRRLIAQRNDLLDRFRLRDDQEQAA